MIHIETNAKQISGLLGRVFRDQIPFALSKAINDTAKDAQRRQRAHQRRIFTVRRPQFVDRAVKIKPFATKVSMFAIMRIDPPGGRARADILTKFETERVKRPRRGERLAIPVDAKRTKSGTLAGSRKGVIRSLELKPTSARVAIGKKRTFSIKQPGGRGGIFQRFGRGSRSRIRLLFTFAPQVPITPNLNFYMNVRATVAQRFDGHFSTAFDHAIRTAR